MSQTRAAKIWWPVGDIYAAVTEIGDGFTPPNIGHISASSASQRCRSSPSQLTAKAAITIVAAGINALARRLAYLPTCCLHAYVTNTPETQLNRVKH